MKLLEVDNSLWEKTQPQNSEPYCLMHKNLKSMKKLNPPREAEKIKVNHLLNFYIKINYQTTYLISVTVVNQASD